MVDSRDVTRSGGEWLRSARESLHEEDPCFSLRQVAIRLGIEPSYLSKIERGLECSPSEELLLKLAKELALDEVLLLAHFGRISSDVKAVILSQPEAFTQLIRSLRDAPQGAVFELVRRASDGKW